MVIRLLPVMEDEELEALRLAALQTLKPRNFERKKNYGNQYNHHYHHNGPHHHNTKPFMRMDHNPNLIVIIPTEVKEEKPADRSSVVTSATKNGSGESATPPTSSTTAEQTHVPEPEPASNAEESAEKSKKHVPARFKRESRDEEELELDFDEELDFECEAADEVGQDDDSIALHADENDTLALEVEDSDKLALHDDDEDSLDKLMDEMEQEFSGKSTSETSKAATEPVKKDKAETRKKTSPPKETPAVSKSTVPAPRTTAPALKEKIVVTKNLSPLVDRKQSPTRRSPPPRNRSRSPNLLSETARANSPLRRSRSPVYRKSRSPRRSPMLSRRSPLPRRLSRSPLTRRSRSPLPTRSRPQSPYRRASPYRRSKSPIHRRSPVRRLSPLPRRSPRRSPPPLSRRSRSRSRTPPPPRRDYRSRSPLPPRRRSRSPSYQRRSLSADRRRPLTRRSVSPRRRSPTPTRGNLRRRTPPPPRRSPLPARRSPLPARSIRRRSTSPGRRVPSRRSPIRRQPREPRAARPAETDSRSRPTSVSERRRTPTDNRSELNSRRELPSRSRSDEELERSKPSEPVEECDPKLEARRKKFESITVVSGTQKKICLKSSSDDALTKRDSPSSPRFASKEVSTDEVEDIIEPSQGVASKEPLSSPFNRVGRGNLTEDRGHQTRVSINTTKDTQTKRLPSLFTEDDEKEEIKVKPTIRYTVEDAKEEIELMKLKRRRKTEQILGEEGENRAMLHIKKKKKKKDKEDKIKRKEKKRELLLAGLAEAEETKPKVTDRVGVNAAVRAEGTDLRAELSRRRAQRLQGQPGSRLIQSALEGVVADKKIKPMRPSPPPDGASPDDPNKMKGRRVQVVAATKKKYTGRGSASDSEDVEDEEEAPKTKRMTSTGILRGTTLHRRSQVLKK